MLQPQLIGMQGAIPCTLAFDSKYQGASSARVTRLTDIGGSRRFLLESQDSHGAACLALQANGKYQDTGPRYYLPFSVLITQVPYPSPSYP